MIEFFGGLVLGLIVGVGGSLAMGCAALFVYEKTSQRHYNGYCGRLEAVLREFEDAGRRASLIHK